jgi:hypothetical protein
MSVRRARPARAGTRAPPLLHQREDQPSSSRILPPFRTILDGLRPAPTEAKPDCPESSATASVTVGDVPVGKVNVTDPDSRPIPVGFGSCRAVTPRRRSTSSRSCWPRNHQPLDRLLTARSDGRRDPGRAPAGRDRQLPGAIAADAGYWNEQQMGEVVASKHIPVRSRPIRAAAALPNVG